MCNESTEVLRATLSAMLCTRDLFLSSDDGSPVRTEDTLEILHFSKRCLMPWIGIGYALRAVRGTTSTDAQLLLGLISLADLFDDMELEGDEAVWQRILDIAIQGVARMVVEARMLPAFSQISLEALEKIVQNIKDDAWSEELEFNFPAKEIYMYPTLSSNKKGFSLGIDRDCVIPSIDRRIMPSPIKRGHLQFSFMRIGITQVAREGKNYVLDMPLANLLRYKDSYESPGYPFDKSQRFEHSDPPAYRFRFKHQISKLNKQCLALASFCAFQLGIAPEEASLEDVWRYFRKLNCTDLAEVLRQCICASFQTIHQEMRYPGRYRDEFFRKLSYDELESLVSAQDICHVQHEIIVLQVLIDWAMQQSKHAGAPHPHLGDVVLVREAVEEDCSIEDSQFVVQKIEGCTVYG